MDVELSGELPREDASSFSSSSSTAPAAAMASKSARPILPALPTAAEAAPTPATATAAAAGATTAAAAVAAEPAVSSSATTNKTSPAAPTVSAATPATSTPSTATGATATRAAAATGTKAPTVSNANSSAPFGVHSPLSLLPPPTTSITPLARAKASALSAELGQWGWHLLLEELCCNLLKDFVDDDEVNDERVAAAADDNRATAVSSQQPSVGSQSKADLIANASKIAAAERAANAAALKASQQAAADEALVQAKAKRGAEKMRASQMASFFGFSPRNGGDGNDQEDERDVLGKLALTTLADLTARRKASRVAVSSDAVLNASRLQRPLQYARMCIVLFALKVEGTFFLLINTLLMRVQEPIALSCPIRIFMLIRLCWKVVLLGDIPRLCSKLLTSAAVDDSALQEVADTAAGWYQEYERYVHHFLALKILVS